jgi:hypothetical protein
LNRVSQIVDECFAYVVADATVRALREEDRSRKRTRREVCYVTLSCRGKWQSSFVKFNEIQSGLSG